MKRIINFLFAVCCVLLLASCTIRMSDKGLGKIKPSKTITTRTFTLTPFDAINMSVVGKVKYIQTTDETYKLVLQAPENYVPLYKIDVKDKRLDIEFVRNRVNIDDRHISITVYSPSIRQIMNTGVGAIVADSLNSADLLIDNAGVGSIDVKKLNAEKTEVRCSGVGSISISGSTGKAVLDCSGVGGINAKDLYADDVRAEVSGVGGIKCYATNDLNAEVSGVGSLRYGGKPKTKSLNRSGIGKISEL